MGAFDTILLSDDEPEHGHLAGTELQTKNLGRCFGHFRIQAKRLEECLFNVWTDQDFHGDLLLNRFEGHELVRYVARFTEGKLQWLRPAESCPETLVSRLEAG